MLYPDGQVISIPFSQNIPHRVLSSGLKDSVGNNMIMFSGTSLPIQRTTFFVSGRYSSANFVAGSYTLQNSDTNDNRAYVAKLDVNGNTTWLKSFGNNNFNAAFGTITDAGDNVLVHGFFTDTLQVDENISLISPASGLFFIKYDGEGKPLWGKKAICTGSAGGTSGTADDEGSFYVCGWYTDSIRFDNFMLLAQQGWESFVVKYDKNGNVLWANNISGPLHEYVEGIAFDGKDHLYTVGHFIGTVHCLTVALNATSFYSHSFVLRFDKSGQFVTGNSWNADGQVSARSVVCLNENRVVIGGEFYGRYMNYGILSVDDGTLQPHNNRSFLLVVDSSFTGKELIKADCGQTQQLYSIARISNTEFYATGEYIDCMTFGTGTISGYQYNPDQFVGKFVLESEPVGINGPAEQMNVSLFPNPARDKIHVNGLLLTKPGVKIEIRNALGECCLRLNDVAGEQMIIDVGSLSDAVYFLTISTSESKISQKLVINRR